MEWVPVAVAVAVLGVLLSWNAGRVDRMHTRLEASRAALEAQLARRSAVALEAATSGLLDPASAVVVADAAHRARTTNDESPESWEAGESVLTQALGAAFDQPDFVATLRGDPQAKVLVDDLAAACRRVQLARRFHNDAVRQTRRLRRKPLVRWLRLSGHAPWPDTAEFDDAMPRGLAA